MSGATTRHLVRALRDRVNGTDWTHSSHDGLMSVLDDSLELLQTLCTVVEQLADRIETLEKQQGAPRR